MIKIYIKMALRVLRRNPFFTTVSLFGISFTLAILMLMVAWFQNQLGNHPPLSNSSGLVYLKQLQQKQIEQDTIWKLDSTKVSNTWKVDSTRDVVNRSNRSSQSSFNKGFLTKYFSSEKMTSTKLVTVMSEGASYDVFTNSRKYNMEAKHIDAAYFEIFDFELVEGRIFSASDISQRALNIVMTTDMALRYFGSIKKAVGAQLFFDNNTFTVIGIVKGAGTNNKYLNGDIFLPISYLNPAKDDFGYFGGFIAVMLSKQNNTEATLAEIDKITANIPFLTAEQSNGDEFNFMKVLAYDHLQLNALNYVYAEDANESKRKVLLIIGVLMFLFTMVPMLNLVNLNVSRIMDRSAEIGVRKAFGASAAQIRMQMIFENVVLTLLGGLLGWIIALILMTLINENHWLDALQLSFNGSVYGVSLFITIFFGILSGLLPASRIARYPIVKALNTK